MANNQSDVRITKYELYKFLILAFFKLFFYTNASYNNMTVDHIEVTVILVMLNQKKTCTLYKNIQTCLSVVLRDFQMWKFLSVYVPLLSAIRINRFVIRNFSNSDNWKKYIGVKLRSFAGNIKKT